MKSNKITYKQLLNYIEQLESQVLNSQQAVYDLSAVITDYIEMRGKSKALNRFMKHKRFGMGVEIPTRWSKFKNFCKTRYLQFKKLLDY